LSKDADGEGENTHDTSYELSNSETTQTEDWHDMSLPLTWVFQATSLLLTREMLMEIGRIEEKREAERK
jgi:hypothetical protein